MTPPAKHVLLMDGPDQAGLVYHVTGVLFQHGYNIIRNDEYVSPDGHFFMRTEFEVGLRTTELMPDGDAISTLLRALQAGLSPGIRLRLNSKKKKSAVVLVTKEHHCLSELLIRNAFDELDAHIRAVIGNYDHLQPLVERFGIPFHTLSHEQKTRKDHEAELLQTIARYEPEYLVLAKYMRVLTPAFVRHFPDRIINIHHSFLPAFVGANPYRQAHNRGVKIIGATAHFVNNDLDEGPIIVQDVKAVDHRHTAQDMATQGRDIEKLVLSKALHLVFNDRVFIHDNRTVVF